MKAGRWVWRALLLWMLPALATAGSGLERMEEHQRIARIGFVVGAVSPLLVLSTQGLDEETQRAAQLGIAMVGIGGSAVGLSLLGRRSMKAAVALDLTGTGGAVALFFDIVAVASGAHYMLAGQNPTSGIAYLVASAGALTAGGLQLRQNRFIADMRTDPRVYITPTELGVTFRF